jgi:hypothetical protein
MDDMFTTEGSTLAATSATQSLSMGFGASANEIPEKHTIKAIHNTEVFILAIDVPPFTGGGHNTEISAHQWICPCKTYNKSCINLMPWV